MTLILQIENFELLTDGGPAQVSVPEKGLQAGRGAGMGWVLPDPSRHISSHHFDVFQQDGSWFLRDVSTNGTFLQGQRFRLDGPHRLTHGDRFQVGQYLIVARLDGAPVDRTGNAAPPQQGGLTPPHYAPPPADDPWSVGGALSPIDPLPPLGAMRRGDDFVHDFIADQRPVAPPPAPPVEQAPPAPAPPVPPVAGSAAPSRAVPGAPPPAFTPADPAPAAPKPSRQAQTSTPAPPAAAGDFVAAFCRGAGLSPKAYTDIDAQRLAESLGAALRHVSREVMLSLQDRAAAKHFARTGERTMRGATDNNPLKFLPEPDQALETMFLRPRAGFQSGPDGLDEALKDLRLHQAALFAALQPALARLLSDLAPESVEGEAEKSRLGTSRKGKAWDVYVSRWDAKTAPHENGILDEFLRHFSDAYRDMIAATRANPAPLDRDPPQ